MIKTIGENERSVDLPEVIQLKKAKEISISILLIILNCAI